MELWDLYDLDRNVTGKTHVRGEPIPDGYYRLVVHICIFNSEGKMLIQHRTPTKRAYPNVWDLSAGGAAILGDDSHTAASRELYEELGIRYDFTRVRPVLTTCFDNGFNDVYCINLDVERIEVPAGQGTDSNLDELAKALTDKTACVIVQYPNFFGGVEDYSGITTAAHANGALAVCSAYPIALSVLKTPGEMDFDIVTGEGQSLGIPLSFGGPYLGFMAAKSQMARKLPGRIVGQTVDKEGKRGFVLTLQAREQHIRREKASSSICSNQALCALTAAVYRSAMGQKGLSEAATLCTSKAHYFAGLLTAIPGVEMVYEGEYFHEFLTTLPKCDEVLAELESEGILGGYPTEKGVLWCVTEVVTKTELDRAAAIVKEVLAR